MRKKSLPKEALFRQVEKQVISHGTIKFALTDVANAPNYQPRSNRTSLAGKFPFDFSQGLAVGWIR